MSIQVEDVLQVAATKAVRKKASVVVSSKLRWSCRSMQKHLEGADKVVYRDLIETLNAKLKKATCNNFKAMVCTGMGNTKMEIQLGGAVLGICWGTREEIIAIDFRVSLGPS